MQVSCMSGKKTKFEDLLLKQSFILDLGLQWNLGKPNPEWNGILYKPNFKKSPRLVGWFMVFNATFNNISVDGGGNQSTWRKPSTCPK
jgi:hypothetical protein